MEGGRIEDRDRAVRGLDQKRDLGTAQDDALRPSALEFPYDGGIGPPRFLADHALSEFLINNVVDRRPSGFFGDEDLQAVRSFEPAAVEVHLHRVPGAQQADRLQPFFLDRSGGRVGNVDERDGHGPGRAFGEPVHGVRANDQPLRPGGLQTAGPLTHELPHPGPVTPPLHFFDRLEVDRQEHQIGRVGAPQPGLDARVYEPVIIDGRMPGHASDEAQGSHGAVPLHALAHGVEEVLVDLGFAELVDEQLDGLDLVHLAEDLAQDPDPVEVEFLDEELLLPRSGAADVDGREDPLVDETTVEVDLHVANNFGPGDLAHGS